MESGNVRGTEEALRDVIISTVSGGFTGACVVAFPVTALFSGEIYVVVSLTGRVAWAFGDSSMTKDEKKAYIFDLNQMIVDFSIGALIGIIVPEAAAEKLVRDAERNRIKSAGKISSEAIKTSYGESSGNISELLENRPELTGTNREKLLSMVQDTKLAAYINEVYRPGASVGDGGTADKLIMEFYEGSSRHLPKAKERLVGINRIIDSGKLGLNDLDIAEALRDDLEYAIDLFK